MNKALRSIELCAGAGGLGLGLAQSGFSHEIVVERDRAACDTLRYNQARGHALVRDWNIVEADVRSIDLSAVTAEPDLLSAGVPCQPFSIGGLHKGADDERNLWPWAIQAVGKLRPRAFLFENVPGMASTQPEYLRYIELALQYPSLASPDGDINADTAFLAKCVKEKVSSDPSYRVFTRILTATDYGVAQKRKRLFIIGLRSDITGDWTDPTITHSADELMRTKWQTGEYWARHGLPMPEIDDAGSKWMRKHNRRGHEDLFAARLAPMQTVRDVTADLGSPTPQGTDRFPDHITPAREARAYPGHTGSPIDDAAKTIRRGDHGVSGGENMVDYGDGTYRHFTTREAARLQSFPDDYAFPGSWSDSLAQLGNAVPTTLAKVVGDQIARALQ